MSRAPHPAWVSRVDSETTAIERVDCVRLSQLVHSGSELFGQIEVIGCQLVLRIVPASAIAVSARDAALPPRPDPSEIWIVDLDARAAEVHAHGSLVERLTSPDLDGGLLDGPVHVRGHVRIADYAEHANRLVECRCQLVGPVSDAGPPGGV